MLKSKVYKTDNSEVLNKNGNAPSKDINIGETLTVVNEHTTLQRNFQSAADHDPKVLQMEVLQAMANQSVSLKASSTSRTDSVLNSNQSASHEKANSKNKIIQAFNTRPKHKQKARLKNQLYEAVAERSVINPLYRGGMSNTEDVDTTFTDDEAALLKQLKEGRIHPKDEAQAKKMNAVLEKEEKQIAAKVDKWIFSEAEKSGQGLLIKDGPYSKLSFNDKITVFSDLGAKIDRYDPESFKKIKKRKWFHFSKSIDWSAFSASVRKVSGKSAMAQLSMLSSANGELLSGESTLNPYADSNLNIAEYATIGGSLTAATVNLGAKQSETSSITSMFGEEGWRQMDRAGVAEVLQGGEILTSASSIIGSLVRLGMAGENFENRTKAEQLLSALPGVLIELANISKETGRVLGTVGAMQSGNALTQLGYNSVAAAEMAGNTLVATGTSLLGVSSAVGGALKMLQSGRKIYEAVSSLNKLEEVEKKINSADFKFAISRAKKTQALKRTLAIGGMLEGATMIAGGIMVAAMATNPIGWILLGSAAAVGGIYGLYKFIQKGRQAKAFVIEILTKAFPKERIRIKHDINPYLMKLGYAKGEYKKFHADFMVELATRIHEAVKGSDKKRKSEALDLLDAIGLKLNKDGSPPTIKNIARRLRNP